MLIVVVDLLMIGLISSAPVLRCRFRFSMPGGTDGMFYSFNMGPVHFISINTESYYFTEYGTDQVFSQYNWLLDDLEVCPVHVNCTCRY